MDVLQMTRKEKKINILAVKLRISKVIARLITVNSWGEEFFLKFTVLSDERHLIGQTVESVIMGNTCTFTRKPKKTGKTF